MADEPDLFDVKRKARRKPTAPAPDGAIQRLIGVYVAEYERMFREKPVVLKRDGAILKRLVLQYDAAKVEQRLRAYMALTDDAFVRDKGFPLSLLPDRWNKLAAQQQRTRGAVPDAQRTKDYLKDLRGKR